MSRVAVGLIGSFVLMALGATGITAQAPRIRESQQIRIITEVTVGVPGAPEGSWDDVLGLFGSLFSKGFSAVKAVQPDVRFCLESDNVPQTCFPVCEDADWVADAYVCKRSTGADGIWLQNNLVMVVQEIDIGGAVGPDCPPGLGSCVPVARILVKDATRCVPRCVAQLPGGTLWVTFSLLPITRAQYTGPFRGVLGVLPPPSDVQEAFPEGEAPAAPAPGLPSRSDVERALDGLRDADNCSTADRWFPDYTGGFGSGEEARKRYQLALLLSSISDPGTRQRLLAAARQKDTTLMDDPGMLDMMMLDAARMARMRTLGRELLGDFLASIVSGGLSRLLPELPSSIDQMILEKLTTDPLAEHAVDMLFRPRPVTAECVVNELMKQNLIDRTTH